MSKISIGFIARLFGNAKTATEEIQFAKNNHFQTIQFRGPEKGLDEPYLREDHE